VVDVLIKKKRKKLGENNYKNRMKFIARTKSIRISSKLHKAQIKGGKD